MPAASPHDTPLSSKPEVELGFGFDAYFTLGFTGMWGIIPAIGCVVAFTTLSARLGVAVPGAITGIGILFALVGSILVPCLVLRMRQPRGAKVIWDDDGIEELDGPWMRARIRWSDAVAIHLEWVRSGKYPRRQYAVQVKDVVHATAVTIWTEPPEDFGHCRRRLSTDSIAPLVHALREHGVAIEEGTLDYSLIDRGRTRGGWVIGVSRLVGYTCTTAAVVTAPSEAQMALVLIAIGLPALLVRAWPTFREWKSLAMRPNSTPSAHPDPYRSPETSVLGDEGRSEYEALLRQAVGTELAIRLAIPVVSLLLCVALAAVPR
jgi:hypothetical protein